MVLIFIDFCRDVSLAQEWILPASCATRQRVKAGFSTSGSLLLALLPGREAQGGASSGVSTPGAEDESALPQPPLLVPGERLSLLPVTPLPGTGGASYGM